MSSHLDCAVVLLLISFKLSTAAPRCLLGAAPLNSVTLSKFGSTCNKRKTLHQSSGRCRGKKEEWGVLRRINQPVETLPTTISKGRWWENFTLWGQQMWRLPKLSERKRSHRLLLSISDIKSEACSSDKVGLMSLKWGNQRHCRWGLCNECSLAPPLASSQPSGARLNPFTLTARQSQVPAPSVPDAPSPPLISCSNWLDWCYISKYTCVCVCVKLGLQSLCCHLGPTVSGTVSVSLVAREWNKSLSFW